jgi:hypothetical protein
MDAGEAIVVGDSPYDAQAAGKIGLRTIGVLCGGFPEQDLRAAGCVAIYRDPADLLARFDQSLIGADAPPARRAGILIPSVRMTTIARTAKAPASMKAQTTVCSASMSAHGRPWPPSRARAPAASTAR